jgi:hypothetical protein
MAAIMIKNNNEQCIKERKKIRLKKYAFLCKDSKEKAGPGI